MSDSKASAAGVATFALLLVLTLVAACLNLRSQLDRYEDLPPSISIEDHEQALAEQAYQLEIDAITAYGDGYDDGYYEGYDIGQWEAPDEADLEDAWSKGWEYGWDEGYHACLWEGS